MRNLVRVIGILLLTVVCQGGGLAQQGSASPRMKPVGPSEWGAAHRDALGSFRAGAPADQPTDNNSLNTCVRNPALCKNWLAYARALGANSVLPPRDRAIIMLRTAWVCQEDYHWGYSARTGKRSGLTNEEILRTTKGPDAPGWTPFERALLRANDELLKNRVISEATWKTLDERYDDAQLMELIFEVGHWSTVAMFHNSAGTQREAGIPPLGGLPVD